MSEEMNDQMLVRRQKLQELYDLGIDPFGSKFDRSGLSDVEPTFGHSFLLT
jgi:lysyl-tRNA synthetase class 2